jgi:fructose-specific phosphotransferase system component IIB
MSDRQLLLYFSWSRPGETGAPLVDIDDRFPAIFEMRRLFYPKFEGLSDPAQVDQGIAGFLDHVQQPNFAAFAELAETLTGRKTVQIERVGDDGVENWLDEALIGSADTIVVISFDSFRTDQKAAKKEVEAIKSFLDNPDHVIFVCPHHDIGDVPDASGEERQDRQIAERMHHGDRGIPPRQGFGGFARTLLTGLGVPVDNRFGLRPAATPDGAPAPVEIDHALDVLDLLRDVETFNLHPHLPQLERVDVAATRMEVLARQAVEMAAPPHPFTQDGRSSFDALLQSRPDTFPGKLLVCDTTMFSSTAGGVDSLRRLWSNLLRRPRRLSRRPPAHRPRRPT